MWSGQVFCEFRSEMFNLLFDEFDSNSSNLSIRIRIEQIRIEFECPNTSYDQEGKKMFCEVCEKYSNDRTSPFVVGSDSFHIIRLILSVSIFFISVFLIFCPNE